MQRKSTAAKLFCFSAIVTFASSALLATASIAAAGDNDCSAPDCNKSSGTVCCDSVVCVGGVCGSHDYTYKACAEM